MYETETDSKEEENELYRAIFKSIYQNGNAFQVTLCTMLEIDFICNWYQTANGVLLMLHNPCSRFKKANDMKSPIPWVYGIGYMFVMVGNGLFQTAFFETVFGILQI